MICGQLSCIVHDQSSPLQGPTSEVIDHGPDPNVQNPVLPRSVHYLHLSFGELVSNHSSRFTVGNGRFVFLFPFHCPNAIDETDFCELSDCSISSN